MTAKSWTLQRVTRDALLPESRLVAGLGSPMFGSGEADVAIGCVAREQNTVTLR